MATKKKIKIKRRTPKSMSDFFDWAPAAREAHMDAERLLAPSRITYIVWLVCCDLYMQWSHSANSKGKDPKHDYPGFDPEEVVEEMVSYRALNGEVGYRKGRDLLSIEVLGHLERLNKLSLICRHPSKEAKNAEVRHYSLAAKGDSTYQWFNAVKIRGYSLRGLFQHPENANLWRSLLVLSAFAKPGSKGITDSALALSFGMSTNLVRQARETTLKPMGLHDPKASRNMLFQPFPYRETGKGKETRRTLSKVEKVTGADDIADLFADTGAEEKKVAEPKAVDAKSPKPPVTLGDIMSALSGVPQGTPTAKNPGTSQSVPPQAVKPTDFTKAVDPSGMSRELDKVGLALAFAGAQPQGYVLPNPGPHHRNLTVSMKPVDHQLVTSLCKARGSTLAGAVEGFIQQLLDEANEWTKAKRLVAFKTEALGRSLQDTKNQRFLLEEREAVLEREMAVLEAQINAFV